MSAKSPRHEMLEHFAGVAKALGHVHRLDLMEYLAQGERGVDELAEAAGLSVANTSQHLQVLRKAGLVDARKDGVRVIYRLSGDDVVDLQGALRRTAERHVAEIDQVISGYFRARDSLEPVSREELLRRAKDGLVTVLDVRPPGEYSAGHLPGAINLPLKDLEKHLGEIPREREVIAYCRGPYCVLAFEAVALLRAKGLKARRLEDGYPEWKAAGLPLETVE
ncbi:MAG: metalloregulator ArsR/SmtB family transcription factor [Rhodospirillales bacterium]|nr:metalloregulator ArsR/SmtB family transcription factor [Rhodospirillales bacterium]